MKLLQSLAGLVFAAVIATPAHAQFDQNNTTSNDVAHFLTTSLTARVQLLQAPGQPIIDAFCVDFNNSIHTNPDPVVLTRLDASASEFNANTRFGYAKYDAYQKAAWLTQFFDPSFGYLGTSRIADLRVAIWHLFTPGAPNAAWPYGTQSSYFTNMLANNAWQHINLKYYFVMSDVNMNAPTRGTNPQVGGNQEFITMVAPEPNAILLLGTGMLGIVGLAPFRRRRKAAK